MAFSSGRILLGFGLGCLCSAALAVAARLSGAVEVLLEPIIQLVKATPVASFVILALVWVRGRELSILISFLMAVPVLYSALRTGMASADAQLLEMARVFRLPWGPQAAGHLAARRAARLPGGVPHRPWACAGKAVWPPK